MTCTELEGIGRQLTNAPVLFSAGMLGYQSFARVHGICVLPSCFTEVECLLQYFTEVSIEAYILVMTLQPLQPLDVYQSCTLLPRVETIQVRDGTCMECDEWDFKTTSFFQGRFV